MNKYIFALILTLLGWTQIQAQNTDLRNAPGLPTVPVTITFPQTVENGTITVMSGNTQLTSGNKIASGSPLTLTVVTNTGYMVDEIKLNGSALTGIEPVFDATKKTTTYTYTIGAVQGKSEFAVTTKAKATVTYKVANMEQHISKLQEPVAVVVSDFNYPVTVQYKYSETDPWSDFDKEKLKTPGTYQVRFSCAEGVANKGIEITAKLTILYATSTLSYTIGEKAKVSATADNKPVANGAAIVQGEEVQLTITTDAGYQLSAVTLDDKSVTLPTGAYAEGHTVYVIKHGQIQADANYVFTIEEKKAVPYTVSNLIQREGTTIVPVKVTSAVSGIEVLYQVGTDWTTVFDATKFAAAGSYPVKLYRAEDLTYQVVDTALTLVVEPKKEITSITLPTAGKVEEGQALAACLLTGGEANVAGSFVWKNPNETANLEKSSYELLFVPTDAAYQTKDTTITVEVIPVYTVTTTSNAFGHIVYKTVQNANNRYAKGSVIQLEAIAEPNYRFSGWSDNVKTASRSITVTEDLKLHAQFDSILYMVEVEQPTNGTLSVSANGVEIKEATELLQGTLLTITATPDKNYQVDQVTVNGALINNGSYVMEADAKVAATFKAKPTEKVTHLVNVATLAHGSVTLTAAGAPITPGAAVEKGTVIKVETVADKGYKFASVSGVTLDKDNTFMVGDEDITLKVTFNPQSYAVNATASAGTITLEKVTETGNETFTAGSEAEYLTKLKVTLAHTNEANYRFINMTANAATIQSGDTVTVTGPLSIVANYAEKIDLGKLIKTETQTYTYAGIARSYEVRVQGYSGLSFDVTYQQNGQDVTPINAGTYDVIISRKADDLFKAVNNLKLEKKLKINKAKMALKKIPAVDANGNLTEDPELTQTIKSMAWKTGTKAASLRATSSITGTATQNAVNILQFTPEDETNYEPLEYSVPVGTVATKYAVTLTNAKAYNGGLEVTDLSAIPTGTVLTLKAESAGKRFVKWSDDETAGIERTVTIDAEKTFKAEFADKLTLSVNNPSAVTYNGQVQLIGNLFGENAPEGIVVRYLNANGLAATPLNAGKYTVAIDFAGDEQYQELHTTKSYTINPQETAVTTVPTASALIQGQALSNSVLTGGVAKAGTATVAGAFAWTNPTKAITASGEQDVTFTSYDPNYTDATTKVNVTATASATPIITFAQPENGTLTVKLADGTEITSGTAVAKEAKITVAVTANEGYELEKLTIGEKEYTSAPQTVTVEGSLTITATLKKKQSQGGSDEPEEEIIPDPVVAERTATTAVITWEKIDGATGYKLHLYAKKGDATPLKTYEFDAEGNLKAAGISFTLTGLTAGESYYVETVAITPQGEVKRGIELTGTPTGIEAIAEGSQLYTIKGAIVIVPTSPSEVMIVSANGRPIFHDEVSGYTQVTANAGIYVVVLKKGNEQVVEKVVVK